MIWYEPSVNLMMYRKSFMIWSYLGWYEGLVHIPWTPDHVRLLKFKLSARSWSAPMGLWIISNSRSWLGPSSSWNGQLRNLKAVRLAVGNEIWGGEADCFMIVSHYSGHQLDTSSPLLDIKLGIEPSFLIALYIFWLAMASQKRGLDGIVLNKLLPRFPLTSHRSDTWLWLEIMRDWG